MGYSFCHKQVTSGGNQTCNTRKPEDGGAIPSYSRGVCHGENDMVCRRKKVALISKVIFLKENIY